MNQLYNSLRIGRLFFRGVWYNDKAIHLAIDHLVGYLSKEITSTSPFILLAAYNNIKTVIAYYAVLKMGKIAVILDPSSGSIETSEVIEDVDPAAIIFINNSTVSFDYSEEIICRKQNASFIINSDLKDVCTIAYTNAEDGYAKGAC